VRPRAGALLGALVLVALGVAGCSGYSGDASNQMKQWANNVGYAALDQQIEADLASLAAGLKGRELKPLHTACDAFVIDADSLYDELPAPDTLATNELAGGLTTFASAGVACSAAPAFGSPSFAKYEELLKKGESEYKAARSRVASFGVS
jgi:hypothetical protein